MPEAVTRETTTPEFKTHGQNISFEIELTADSLSRCIKLTVGAPTLWYRTQAWNHSSVVSNSRM